KREVPHYRSYGSNYYPEADAEADPFEDVPFAVRSDKKPADAWTTWQDDLRAYEKESQQKPVSVPDMTRKKYEFSRFGSLINEKVTKMQTGATIKDLKILKIPFIEQAQVKSLDEVARLTEDDLVEAARNWPNALARLVIDLLHDRSKLKADNARQAATLLELSKDKAK
ncbi:MAG TPA: hypothetical protein VIY48_01110, partial [Candidatus Paceibacterota bacterium]